MSFFNPNTLNLYLARVIYILSSSFMFVNYLNQCFDFGVFGSLLLLISDSFDHIMDHF